MITLPVPPGIARRLGIRRPTPPPGLLVIAPSRLTDEQYEAFKAKWLAAWNAETKAIYASLPHGKPYLMPAIERAARPRRWWLGRRRWGGRLRTDQASIVRQWEDPRERCERPGGMADPIGDRHGR